MYCVSSLFSSAYQNVAFVDFHVVCRGFVFDVVIEFNFMVVLPSSFFFPISASLPFLFTWYFGAKVFRFECSFGWRALPLSVTKLISLLLFVFCSHLILSFAVSVSRSKHQIQVTVSSVSSVFYYYHIMSSFLYIEMLTGDVACVLSYSVFTDKHKIA